MATVNVQPLSALAPSPMLSGDALVVGKVHGSGMGMHHVKSGFGHFVFWFILLTVFIWLIIYALRPTWALAPAGTQPAALDTGKILWTSIVIALVLLLILWLIVSFAGKGC